MKNIEMKFILMCMVLSPVFASMCDDETEYVSNEKCCKKCKPGTYMTLEICETPICTECPENEFQPSFTVEIRCKKQAYCDPNLHFVRPSSSKKKSIPCECDKGFHCSSVECLTCAPHTSCEEGFGVSIMGNKTTDTVCTPCPSGTFSNTISAEDKCTSWTECPDGSHVKIPGTEKSDTVCATSLTRYILPAVFVTFIFVIIVILVKMHDHQKLKDCFKKMNIKQEQNPNNKVPQVNQAFIVPQMPQEDDEVPNQPLVVAQPDEATVRLMVTDNNNPVAQEEGKRDHIAQPDLDHARGC